MVKYDIHHFSADALPLLLQLLQSHGFRVCSYKSVSPNEVRFRESDCPSNCIQIKVKYHV